ncbi:hypothetical protein BDV24DRAFT_129457 [Aspergillus arachidicola]|uniref:Uncharacterized protein n=1 Tax=Aspergillus arachidicola TaxID=656916 RepID=A0A5N6YCQ7_9EURO|nr:hypothetical protein BDV24DRAFT_129457 [Aspergillus arachidicola]
MDRWSFFLFTGSLCEPSMGCLIVGCAFFYLEGMAECLLVYCLKGQSILSVDSTAWTLGSSSRPKRKNGRHKIVKTERDGETRLSKSTEGSTWKLDL